MRDDLDGYAVPEVPPVPDHFRQGLTTAMVTPLPPEQISRSVDALRTTVLLSSPPARMPCTITPVFPDTLHVSAPRQNGRGVMVSNHAPQTVAWDLPAFTISDAERERLRAAALRMGVTIDRLVGALREWSEHVGRAARSLTDQLTAVGALPEPVPTEARERALFLAQHRGHGPERTPAGKAKRPRRV